MTMMTTATKTSVAGTTTASSSTSSVDVSTTGEDSSHETGTGPGDATVATAAASTTSVNPTSAAPAPTPAPPSISTTTITPVEAKHLLDQVFLLDVVVDDGVIRSGSSIGSDETSRTPDPHNTIVVATKQQLTGRQVLIPFGNKAFIEGDLRPETRKIPKKKKKKKPPPPPPTPPPPSLSSEAQQNEDVTTGKNDDDDDEEEEEEQQQQQQEGNAAAAGGAAAGERPLLISEEEWFRLNTLRDASSQQERYDDGTPNHNNLVQQRVNDERSYANRVIQDAFRRDEEEGGDGGGTKRSKSRSSSFGSTGSSSFSSSTTSVSSTTSSSSSSSMIDEAERRQKQLKKWKKQMYQLQIETFEDYTTATAGDSGAKKSAAVAVTPPPLRFPLHAIALRSETVFAMAGSTFSTRFLMRCPTTVTSTSTTTISSSNDNDVTDMVVDEMGDEQHGRHQDRQQQQEREDTTKGNSNVCMVLPLRDYPRTHADVFFRLLLGEIDPDEIPDDAVIDCCRLAHYLQCDRIRSSSSSSIDQVDDKENSNDKPPTNMEIVRTRPAAPWGQDDMRRMTLVEEIADVCLNPSVDSNNCMSLCQLAAQFELETLRDISLNHIVTSLSTLEGHEFWDELPVSLRTEIERMRTIMQTEQHLHGGKATKKKLFFNSCREYIALLEEQYEYHLERLEDANFEQQQKALEIGMCYRTHSSWLYAQFKIERHASKVRALKLFLDEQRRIFGSSSSSSR